MGLGHVGADHEEHLARGKSAKELVMAPEPNVVASPATVGACQVRAQWSMLLVLITARKSFCIW